MAVGAYCTAGGFANPFVESRTLIADMPLRDYVCEACGHRQEELIRRPEDELELSCSACGSRDLSRQLSAPARSGGGSDCGDTGFG